MILENMNYFSGNREFVEIMKQNPREAAGKEVAATERKIVRDRMSPSREEKYMDMDKHKAERHTGEMK